MKKIIMTIMSGAFCSAIAAIPSIPSIPVPISSAVNKMINRVDPNINISMMVKDLTTGQLLFQRNSDRPLIPASNMKLFSEAATLLTLGPDYQFQRQISTDATTLDNGTLNGSVYLTLPGDPSFSTADMKALLSTLSTWGVKRITGNVVLVNKNASIDAYPPGRDPRDKTHSYGAPITPIIMDENSLTLIVNPGKQASEPAYVSVSAPDGVFQITNTAKTAAKPTISAVGYRLDPENKLSVTGAIGPSSWAIETRLAILNPLGYSKNLVKALLSEQQIALQGSVIQGNQPPSALVISSQYSKPLHQLMADTLKPSDNVFADALFIHTASIINGSPVNWLQANNVVKQFLQHQTGINLSSAILMDGSGLSKQDRITAQQTVGLLSYIYTHFPIAYEFIAALPISGQDGTLQHRFRKPSQMGQIRAKTGTMAMTGALSLSGYLSAANGHTLAFAIYVNRHPKTPPNVAGRYHWLIDELCDYFLQLKPGGRQTLQANNVHTLIPFQQHPSQALARKTKQNQWRGLELSLRRAFRGQNVRVEYQPNQLTLKDNTVNMNAVWNTLIGISKKYPFSIALESQQAPDNRNQNPHLLWVKASQPTPGATRIWVLRKTTA